MKSFLVSILSLLWIAQAGATPSSLILERVEERVKNAVIEQQKPVVIFDLDETLINSRTRTLRILRDYAFEWKMVGEYPEPSDQILRLTEEPRALVALAYRMKAYPLYLEHILREIGAYDAGLVKLFEKRYVDDYLSNRYCADDVPMPGAVAYAKRIRSLGGHVVYLTGRNWPGMGQCTQKNLDRRGFPSPLKGEATLMMKPNRTMDDTEFKRQVMEEIRKLGTVVGGFENEPANLNLFKIHFPSGDYGFVDSTHSKRPDVPFPGAEWIKDFE